eukprot:TRINITY_DN149_c0_g3_i1.p2 TRINITY_DN149_c0_g3~~TRINITY_DN149_c0_g3_i1.p2  ORF type:complete len:370 (-),score=85.08 TRINITY_DN149_c0_g3_i1:51-1160(-)
MKVFLFVAALFVCANSVKWHQLEGYTFENFVAEHKKVYNPTEFQLRSKIFNANLAKIKKHNMDTTKTWKEGVNHFTDLTDEEFRGVLGLNKGMLYNTPKNVDTTFSNEDASKYEGLNFDWRLRGIVTAVKDQGRCGSCWSFATAETLESHWAMATGQLTDLSEQQVLDCTPNPNDCGGTGGCEGGTAELGFAQIQQLGGLSTQWTYPYQSYFGSNFECRLSSNTPPLATVTGYINLPSNQYSPVLVAIANIGPLAINVDASAWRSYESGVFNGCNQTNPDINHVVQLVGYGTDPLGDYWLVRNSWGPVYGEGGYIRLLRESTPSCGVDLNPSDGVGCNGGPKQVVVCGTCGILYDVVYPNVTVTSHRRN